MSVSVWEAIFMLVVLKIPLVYLATVVWWAVRAEPLPGDDGERPDVFVPLTPCGWNEWRRRRPTRPGKRPIRPSGRISRPARVARTG
ncbi:MAG TPA: hypothetical protein VLA69_09705 [Gaiellaceae bacterium]|nr:hypothetical protein [Gaiellaceae bacterium]